ncbi:MAG TPA: thioredoxin family protein [Campylobacterales bacterium]|nr:thioredoxin family protein [Campylobacterales bacterium]
MKKFKTLVLLLLSTLALDAQSFYTLTDVKTYDPLVITEGKELNAFDKDIKSLMYANALELDINITGHPTQVLAFVINKFSLADTIGVRVILELGEYVRRKGSEEEVFAISYVKQKIFPYNKEELEDDLADTVEEMLEIFATQYIDDNKKLSEKKKIVSHETFDKDMEYENDYKVALSKARKESKDLMVFMTTAYCPWCRKLENRILSQGHIDKKIKAKHIPVMLNFDEKKFPKNLEKISVVPTLYVVDARTEVIKETFVGFSSRNMFLNYLKGQDEK